MGKHRSKEKPVATRAPKEKTRKPRATTRYPKVSLVDALRLAESIRDNNAGQPYNRIDLAASIDLSPESSVLRTLITASTKYGLTEGSYAAERVGLTELGTRIVSPTSDEEKAAALLEALYRIDFYKDFFEQFRTHRLPRRDLLLNTLEREFSIPNADREQCYELLLKNARELSLLKDVKGTLYVRFDTVAVKSGSESFVAGEDEENEGLEQEEHVSEEPVVEKLTSLPESEGRDSGAATAQKPRIFISHSKNKKILNQIKSNLEFGGFHYKVAIETETTAIPIPEKIFGMMRECNCAIVNVSADEQERREDGSYGINANVLVEIGAAFLAYNQRVILLVDKRLSMPSNLQGLYRCEYTGEELDSGAVTKLQKGLLQFRVPVD